MSKRRRGLTVHYTPKHANWLNQAEIGIGIYAKQVLVKTDRKVQSVESNGQQKTDQKQLNIYPQKKGGGLIGLSRASR